MPKIVKPNLIKIPARAYRAVRSFVESSLKDEYSWNVGVLHGNVATFTKHGKWTLRTFTEGGLSVRALHLPDGSLIVKYNTRALTVIASNEIVIDCDKPDLHTYFLVPSEEVPFARPISVAELIDKLNKYPTPDSN